jgi:hypothetical protein
MVSASAVIVSEAVLMEAVLAFLLARQRLAAALEQLVAPGSRRACVRDLMLAADVLHRPIAAQAVQHDLDLLLLRRPAAVLAFHDEAGAELATIVRLARTVQRGRYSSTTTVRFSAYATASAAASASSRWCGLRLAFALVDVPHVVFVVDADR